MLVTIWLYGDGANVINVRDTSGGIYIDENVTPPAAWTRYSWITKTATQNSNLQILAFATMTFYVDDVSIIALDDLSITATAANLANATEGLGVRVGGLSTLIEPIPAGKLKAMKGKIRFLWTPRHGDGDYEKFGSSDPKICTVWYDGENRMIFDTTTNINARLTFEVNNVLTIGDWATPGFVAGTKYLVEIEYNSTQCTVSIDGAVVITVTPVGGIDFGAKIPNIFYAGTYQTGVGVGDAVFSAP